MNPIKKLLCERIVDLKESLSSIKAERVQRILGKGGRQ